MFSRDHEIGVEVTVWAVRVPPHDPILGVAAILLRMSVLPLHRGS
jgi:hypothetical protein